MKLHLAKSCMSGALLWNSQTRYPVNETLESKVNACYLADMRSALLQRRCVISDKELPKVVEPINAILLKRRLFFWMLKK